MVGVALVLSALAASRMMGDSAEVTAVVPKELTDWDRAADFGVVSGTPGAKATLMVFSDFECPACGRYNSVLEQVKDEFRDDLRFIHLHFPLSQHRFALPAARASECAHELGQFDRFASELYESQDSLGLKSWGALAAEAGISDTARVSACAWSSVPVARIERSIEFARSNGIASTPTIVLNGIPYAQPPALEVLRADVRRILGQ